MSRIRPLAPLALLLVTAPLAAQTVWVVDDDGGTGVDFTDLQPAVDAAAPGDVVLVRAGSYLPFQVDGKPLAIVGDQDAQVVIAGPPEDATSRVRNLAAGDVFVLRNLTITPPSGMADDHLTIEDCEGVVWLEDVELDRGFPFFFFTSFQSQVLHVVRSDAVVLSSVAFEGMAGSSQGFGPEFGSVGLVAHDSVLHVFRTEGIGGFNTFAGATGRPAVELDASTMYAHASRFEGAKGGSEDPMIGAEVGMGGTGVVLVNGSVLIAIDTELVGGPSGELFGGGPIGLPSEVDGTSTLTEVDRPSALLEAPVVVRDDAGAELTFGAAVGSPLFLIADFAPGPLHFDPFPGTSAVGLAPVVWPLGPIGADGSLAFTSDTPDLPPGLDAFDYTVQAIALDPSGFLAFSNPTLLHLVDDAF